MFLFLFIQDSTESAQVWERGGDGIRKDLALGLFQGSPKAQPRYMHKAIGSNILSEFEETFLLKILNAFHSRQGFSCVKNFKATVSVKCSAASGYRQNSDRRSHAPIPLYHRHGFCCWFHSQTVLHVLTAQTSTSQYQR